MELRLKRGYITDLTVEGWGRTVARLHVLSRTLVILPYNLFLDATMQGWGGWAREALVSIDGEQIGPLAIGNCIKNLKIVHTLWPGFSASGD